MADQETRKPGHRQTEHTADLAVELWAPTEEALLVEGLHALMGLLTEGATVDPDTTRTVEVSALDPEDRLVRWLGELLYLATVEGFLACNADVELRGTDLRAEVHGRANAADRLRTEIKAITYHDLSIHHADGQVTARVVMDV